MSTIADIMSGMQDSASTKYDTSPGFGGWAAVSGGFRALATAATLI